MRKKVLGMILAGGKGERLYPLTRDRAKPAVPFGGKYRIIDFVLSNFVNSNIYSLYVLTQFKSQSLMEHLQEAWMNQGLLKDHFITAVPAQMRTGESWFKGTADAVYQNLELIHDTRPDLVAVFGGDHIYRMDLRQMVQWHEDSKADVTVAILPVPMADASRFGVVEVDPDLRVNNFVEKSQHPPHIPGDPERVYGSMGNYIFNTEFLFDVLTKDAETQHSGHDFGRDIFPKIIKEAKIFAYDFSTNVIPGEPVGVKNTYWKDIGTIHAYWEANMDLRDVIPQFNLFNHHWPIRTIEYGGPPTKFVHESDDRTGRAITSIVCEGSIFSGCTVRNSVIGRNVRIHSYAELSECIVMDNVMIEQGAKLRRVIVDKNVRIPRGEVVGYDLENDRKKYFVCKEGIIVIPRKPRTRKVAELDVT